MPSSYWKILLLSLLSSLVFPNKVILFLTEDIELADIDRLNYPAFSYIRQHANWGLVSTRRSKLEEIIGAISAGAYPLVRKTDAYLGFNAREKWGGIEAKYILFTRTGAMPSSENIVQIAIEAIKTLNKEEKTGAHIGFLGSLLRANGYKVAVLGNSDVDQPRRLAVLIACDENGIVDKGNVGEELLKNEPLSVAGKVIDLQKFRNELSKVASCSLIVVDSGEMGRYTQMETYLSPIAKLVWREDAIRRVDALLQETIRIYQKGDLFIFLSLIGKEKDKPDRLSPIAILSDEGEGKLLTSSSTHTKGLVNLPDITATILGYYRLSSQTFPYGTTIKPCDGSWVELSRLALLSTLNGVAQPLILVIFLSIYLIGFFLALYAGISSPLLFSLLFPSTCYFAPLFHPWNLSSFLFIVFFLNLMLYIFLWGLSRLTGFPLSYLPFISISLLIIIDTLLGGKLSQNSPIAIYALGGCRFYGVGNEYGGILLSTLPFAISYLSKSELALLLGTFISALIMGLPFFGANVGVSISLFALFLFLLYFRKGKHKFLLAFSLSVFFAISILTLSHFCNSHLGAFLRLIMKNNTQSINLLYNKLMMNLSIASETGWKAGMLVLAGLFLLAIMKGLRVTKEEISLFIPTFISVIFAFFLNDTGAILILFALLYLLTIFLLKGNENIRC